MRLAHLGKKYKSMTKEGRKNISKSAKGNTNRLGIHCSEESKKKISFSKKRNTLKGEKSWLWLGDKVKYRGLHKWVELKLGKPTKCEHCGKDGLSGNLINWANIGHTYRRNLNDWLRLCVKCHYIYDGKIK